MTPTYDIHPISIHTSADTFSFMSLSSPVSLPRWRHMCHHRETDGVQIVHDVTECMPKQPSLLTHTRTHTHTLHSDETHADTRAQPALSHALPRWLESRSRTSFCEGTGKNKICDERGTLAAAQKSGHSEHQHVWFIIWGGLRDV